MVIKDADFGVIIKYQCIVHHADKPLYQLYVMVMDQLCICGRI